MIFSHGPTPGVSLGQSPEVKLACWMTPKTPDGRRKKHGVPAMVERGAGDDHRWWNIYIYVYIYICTYIYTHTYNMIYIYIFEGSLEVKLPTIWTVEKQR